MRGEVNMVGLGGIHKPCHGPAVAKFSNPILNEQLSKPDRNPVLNQINMIKITPKRLFIYPWSVRLIYLVGLMRRLRGSILDKSTDHAH